MFIIPCCEKPKRKLVMTMALDGSENLVYTICLNCGAGENKYRDWLNA